MNIHLTIDAPKGWKRRALLHVCLPIALVAATAAVAGAYDTSWIAPGQPVSSSKLKANLDEVQTRLDALETAPSDVGPQGPPGATGPAGPTVYTYAGNGKQYSLNAVFCGLSPNTQHGNIGGYSGVKTICEGTCGSPAAHMCTSEELVRTGAVGAPSVPGGVNAWFSKGTSSQMPNGLGNQDCGGWTVGTNNAYADFWVGAATGGQPAIGSCDIQHLVACCL